MDEARAIELCLKHRDPIGFEFLVRQYRREAFVHARALLGHEQDALDACQEAFSKAFAALPRLGGLTRFYPWFYCILRNHCFNVLARRQTARRYQQMHGAELGSAPEPTAAPHNALEAREEQARVQQALERLTPEHREILVMKYLQEYTYEQIAGVLGIPRGTVMSRLYHARLALRDAYTTGQSDPPTPATEDAR